MHIFGRFPPRVCPLCSESSEFVNFELFFFFSRRKKKNQPADWSDVSERKKQEEGPVLLPTSVCSKEKTQLISGGVKLKEGQRRVFKSHEDDLYLT